MYKLKNWHSKLDLKEFYFEAKKRGFVNNSSQENMIDCFNNEKEKQFWILYKDTDAIGSVGAHSFDDLMGDNSYRVLTRVCAFKDRSPGKSIMTLNKMIKQHQNFSDQFFLPQCIEWANSDYLYATSNESSQASQRLVHKLYFPTLEEMGLAKKIKDTYYRYTFQTVWQIFPDNFLKSLNKYPRWQSCQ